MLEQDIKEIKYGKRTYKIRESHLNEVAQDCIENDIDNTFDTFLDGFETSQDLHFLLSALQNENGYLTIILNFLTMKENNKIMREMNTALNYGELN